METLGVVVIAMVAVGAVFVVGCLVFNFLLPREPSKPRPATSPAAYFPETKSNHSLSISTPGKSTRKSSMSPIETPQELVQQYSAAEHLEDDTLSPLGARLRRSISLGCEPHSVTRVTTSLSLGAICPDSGPLPLVSSSKAESPNPDWWRATLNPDVKRSMSRVQGDILDDDSVGSGQQSTGRLRRFSAPMVVASNDLGVVLRDKAAQREFMAFLRASLSAENLMFYQAVESVVASGSVAEARALFDRFIRNDAKYMVNLSGLLQNDIRLELADHPTDRERCSEKLLEMLKRAQQQVYELMENDLLPRYRSQRSQTSRNEATPPNIPSRQNKLKTMLSWRSKPEC